MAKQKGIIPLVGTLGGMNLYLSEYGFLARRAGGGFNSNAIKTKPSMRRVRENGAEFGNCSRVNKAFRMALRPFYAGFKFSNFHSRLMTLFTGLKGLDAVNKRGERVVFEGAARAEGLDLIKNFVYTPDCNVRAVLPFSFSVDATTYALTISEFAIKRVGFISGATHIGLTYGVLDFDFGTLDYELQLAEPLVLGADFSGDTVTLVPDVLPSGAGTLLCVLGVRFYQEVNGTLYLLHAADGVGFFVIKSE